MNSGFLTRTFIGKARISLIEVAGAGSEGLKRWCPLMNEDLEVFKESHGDIEVSVTWTYDEDPKTKSGFFKWASSKKKKKVDKLGEEVTALMSQMEGDEAIIRKQRRTKAEQDQYELAR